MMISRCCKEDVKALVDYYVCMNCYRSCDTLFPLQLSKDDDHVSADTGTEN